MSGHTPTPWHVQNFGSFATEIRSGSGRRIAQTWVQGSAKSPTGALNQAKTNEANAAFIVEAVNSHEALVAENKRQAVLIESKDETIRQLTEEVVRHLKALKLIAAPRDCGCSPVCQCNSQESLEIEVAALRDIARAALSTPSPEA